MTPHEFVLDPQTFYCLWEGIRDFFPVYDWEKKINVGDRIILSNAAASAQRNEIRAQVWHVFRDLKGAPKGQIVVRIIDPIMYTPKEGYP